MIAIYSGLLRHLDQSKKKKKFLTSYTRLGSHCRRALAPAPAPELSSTHSLAPTPAPELSSTYPLAPAPAPAIQLFNKQVVYHLVFKSFCDKLFYLNKNHDF